MTDMRIIESAAKAEATFDGRPWDAMPRHDRERYLTRSQIALIAADIERITSAARLAERAAHVLKMRHGCNGYEGCENPVEKGGCCCRDDAAIMAVIFSDPSGWMAWSGGSEGPEFPDWARSVDLLHRGATISRKQALQGIRWRHVGDLSDIYYFRLSESRP